MDNDLISRQVAIDMLGIAKELLSRALDETDVVDREREKYEWGLALIEAYIAFERFAIRTARDHPLP